MLYAARGGQLGHETSPVEPEGAVVDHTPRLAEDHGDGDDGDQGEQDVQQPPEDAVHPVVAVDGQQRGADGDHDRDQVGVPAEGPVQPLRQQHLVGHVEGQVGEQHGEQCDDHAAEAELGARLNHLRQPQGGSLRRVQGHERGADQNPGRAGHDRPAEGQSE
jgi:hypothetical protein